MSYKVKGLAAVAVVLFIEILFVFYGFPSRIDTIFDGFLDADQILSLQTRVIGLQRREQIADYFAQRAVKVSEVDCYKVLTGDTTELERANAIERAGTNVTKGSYIEQLASNCDNFVRTYGFITDPLTDVENNFPIAYSILIFKHPSQFVNLLKAVYRPQNFYCIHVDKKADPHFRRIIEAVVNCFPNIFMASRTINVHWGYYSVLEPEIVCLKDLWQNKTWKYFINLTGQEFPLKTNYELVRILSAFKGANDISGGIPNKFTINTRWKHVLPAPHNISMHKGAVHVVASRAFVQYALHSPEAKDFLKWCKHTLHPDEHFFNSLNYSPHLRIPGSYSGNKTHPSMARYKNWVPTYPCPGQKIVRAICILSALDLPMLHTRKEMFANKFYVEYSHMALKCLAEAIHNRTRDQTLGVLGFDSSYYEGLPFVKDRF